MLHAVCHLLFLSKLVHFFWVYIYSGASSGFSIGLRFYYWSQYQQYQRLDPASGYKNADLYIPQKYPTLKDELFNCKYLSEEEYSKDIMRKAMTYHNTSYAKSIKARSAIYCPPYYGIRDGSIITVPHLISLILYTDYTDLCTDFSSTFRKTHTFETLDNIKRRNQNFWWMSKLLRETVEIFGDSSFNANGGRTLKGPYYSGLSFIIPVSNFFLRLSSPTSTTKNIAVAMKFGGDNGIILKLDNPEPNDYTENLRGFDCSTISRFREEDERYAHDPLLCVSL